MLYVQLSHVFGGFKFRASWLWRSFYLVSYFPSPLPKPYLELSNTQVRQKLISFNFKEKNSKSKESQRCYFNKLCFCAFNVEFHIWFLSLLEVERVVKANDRDYNEKFQYAVSDHTAQPAGGGALLRARRGIHAFVESHGDKRLSLLAHLESAAPCAFSHTYLSSPLTAWWAWEDDKVYFFSRIHA